MGPGGTCLLSQRQREVNLCILYTVSSRTARAAQKIPSQEICLIFMCVFLSCMSVQHMCACYQWGSEEGTGSCGTVVTNGCETPCWGWWQPNLSSLREQPSVPNHRATSLVPKLRTFNRGAQCPKLVQWQLFCLPHFWAQSIEHVRQMLYHPGISPAPWQQQFFFFLLEHSTRPKEQLLLCKIHIYGAAGYREYRNCLCLGLFSF